MNQSSLIPGKARWLFVLLLLLVALMSSGQALAVTATISVAPAAVSEGEQATVTVQLNEPPAFNATVAVDVSGNGTTAVLGQDYQVPGAVNGVVTLNFGTTTAQAFTVTSTSDTQVESSETVSFVVNACEEDIGDSVLVACDGGVGESATLTINDNSPVGVSATISVAPAAVSEGGQATVTVQLNEPPVFNAIVNVDVSGNGTTAVLGQDYQVPDAVNGVVTLNFGTTTSQGFTVTSSSDSQIESAETASFVITGCNEDLGGTGDSVLIACSAGVGESATLTINEASPLNLSIEGGNSQIALSGQPLEPFVVGVTSSGVAVSGVAIVWSLQQGEGSISSERSLTDAQGLAGTTLTPTSNGTYVVSAQIEGTDLSVVFSASLDPLSSLSGLTPNQRVIARTVETLCPRLGAISGQRTLTSGEQDLLTQCNALISSAASNPSAAVQGVVALTPEQASAPRKMTSRITGAQLDNIATRLTALRHGAHGVSLGNLTLNLGGQPINGNAFASLYQHLGATGGAASADDGFEFERLGIFVNGNIDWGDKDRTSNEDGFDFKTLGITAGVDYRFLEGLVLGLALGYGNTDVDIDANGGDLGANSWTAMFYGTYYATDHFYLEGSASYGWGSYDQTRNIAYTLLGGSREAKADFDGNQYAFMLGAGYDFIRGEGILDVYGRLQYMRADIDAYRESGASGLDLEIGSQTDTSFKSILGVNYTRSISTAKVVLVPQGWLEWAHEFDDGDDEVTGVFANDPSRISFALATDQFDSDYFRLGLGLGAQFGQGRTAFVSYEAAIGLNDYTEHTASAGVRLEF